MASNNPVLLNAAIAGMAAGLLDGRASTDAVAGDYVAIKNAAVVFATLVDAVIPADATLSAANATLPPATAAEANGQATRPAMMLALCKAYFTGRSLTGVTATDIAPGTYTTAVASVVAQYTEMLVGFDAA
jgi:hypothetical protein